MLSYFNKKFVTVIKNSKSCLYEVRHHISNRLIKTFISLDEAKRYCSIKNFVPFFE